MCFATWSLACGLFGLLALGGCETPLVPRPLGPAAITGAGDRPGETEAVIAAYNRQAGAAGRLWAITRIDAEWVARDGRRERFDGEGRLLLDRPDDVAMTVGKAVIDTAFWAGGDGRAYWLFDLLEDRAWYGRGRGDGLVIDPLPIPMGPGDLRLILGLEPVDEPDKARREWERGYLVVSPAYSDRWRVWLDPRSGRAARVDVLDDAGEPAVVSLLSEARQIEDDEAGGLTSTIVMTVAEVYSLDPEARVTLRLRGVTDGRSRVRPIAFDFDALLRAHKPDVIYDLDTGEAVRRQDWASRGPAAVASP